jgi:hypothetical protein
MSAELHVDEGAAPPSTPFETVVPGIEPPDDRRPNVSGDLPTLFQAAPMFRRAVIGYDRFQVDTYVQWAEDELVTAAREREHLVARHHRTQAALDDARELLSHSSAGGEMLGMSRRIGSMLAAAADEAESIRSEAEAARSAATAQANRKLGYARWRIGYAEAKAKGILAETATVAGEMRAEAGRIVDAAEQTARDARAEAAVRLEGVREIERRAAEDAGRIRQRAVDEASAARLQARDEVVRLLSTGREERRRADAEAAATRARREREAAAHHAAVLAEVTALESRRSALRAEVELLWAETALLDAHVTGSTVGRLDVHLSRFVERLRWRPRPLRTP